MLAIAAPPISQGEIRIASARPRHAMTDPPVKAISPIAVSGPSRRSRTSAAMRTTPPTIVANQPQAGGTAQRPNAPSPSIPIPAKPANPNPGWVISNARHARPITSRK